MNEQPLFIVYRNWRGEIGVREIYPKSTYFGVTQWHPEPQWFMLAHDVSKGAIRDFAMTDILSLHANYDDAANTVRPETINASYAVGDEFATPQGIRIRIEQKFDARPRTEPTALMPALPAVGECYQVIELDGVTPGATWTASPTFFYTYCTRVHPETLTNKS
jgi:hypothetical protein